MSLISEAFFKDFNNVSDNLDSREVQNYILRAEQEVKFLIGKEFYDQLLSQYESAENTSGLSTDNLNFYDPYLINYIAKQAYSYLLKGANYAVTRSGLRVLSEDNSTIASDKMIGEIIKECKQEVIQYRDRMINFLRGAQQADSSKYPLFDDSCRDLGTSFHITSVSKTEDVYCKINKQINYGA